MGTLKKSLITLAFFGCASAAFAQPPAVGEAAPVKVVAYGDIINVNSPGGRHVLDTRIRRAASYVCTGHGRRTLQQERDQRRCVNRAIANAQGGVQRALSLRATQVASR